MCLLSALVRHQTAVAALLRLFSNEDDGAACDPDIFVVKIFNTAMPWSIFDGVFQGSISTRFGNDWRDILGRIQQWCGAVVMLWARMLGQLCAGDGSATGSRKLG